MNRILIIGSSGSGKTTFAKQLSEKKGIVCYDLDEYYWLPNWQCRDLTAFQVQVDAIINKPQWIISGNYSAVRNSIIEKADTIIWLDYSFIRCFYQAFCRSLKRAWKKEPCCNGNYESFRQTFLSKHSPLLWIIRSHARYRKEYNELFQSNIKHNKVLLKFDKPIKIVYLEKK